MATGIPHQNITALQRAVAAAGSQNALARGIGRKQSTVWDWLNRGAKVSAEDAVAIERTTGVAAELINSGLAEFVQLRGIEKRVA